MDSLICNVSNNLVPTRVKFRMTVTSVTEAKARKQEFRMPVVGVDWNCTG